MGGGDGLLGGFDLNAVADSGEGVARGGVFDEIEGRQQVEEVGADVNQGLFGGGAFGEDVRREAFDVGVDCVRHLLWDGRFCGRGCCACQHEHAEVTSQFR